MDRLEAFEKMLSDIQEQAAYETEQMERLRSEGREKTATFRQYLGNRMLYQAMLARYREYGLIGEQARQ
ncbi:MAG: hypothetical protein IKG69_06275 [Atopobiaceae bacterium]|nr:hypothetical protein [Atopobiaceae bacterium]MBR3384789.1 hypothetical protein [Atopobiaceae bacterium]